MGQTIRLSETEDRIAVVTIDQPGRKVNTLSSAVWEELARVVDDLERSADRWNGCLFQSGKPGQFVAGADLAEIARVIETSSERISALFDLGLGVLRRISRLPYPTAALIEGLCLGGGAELVLAMDVRIAARNPMTAIGFPEVQLGLIPAWGGTQRLPRLIGLAALPMIVSGEPVSAARALELGLVDAVVPPERLMEEGIQRVAALRQEGRLEERRRLSEEPLVPRVSERELRAAVETCRSGRHDAARSHNPAPLVALDAMAEGAMRTLDEGLAIEGQAALDVFCSPAASNLIAVFFLKTRRGRDPGVEDATIVPRPIGRVGVLGAGQMGSGIAAALLQADLAVTLVDIDEASVARGVERVAKLLSRPGQAQAAAGEGRDLSKLPLQSATTLEAVAGCDLVIEAITEDEALKRATFARLAGLLGETAILASNTSTIEITRMAGSVPDPGRFAGMHFFHPVDRMELIEVIRGGATTDQTVVTLAALARRLRKTPIVVRDGPGFLVSRLLFPYLGEAVELLREGIAMDRIDEAARSFGMRMGPIAVMDLIGLDTVLAIARVMSAAFPGRMAVSPLLEDLVRAGRLGRKSGAGFRDRRAAEPRDREGQEAAEGSDSGASAEAEARLIDRMFLPMLAEATRVLEEGLVRQPEDIDLGLILGIGFPAVRGGLLRWCDAEGAGAILNRLVDLEPLGARFEPTELLRRMAANGERFYPRASGLPPEAGPPRSDSQGGLSR